jgi:succinylglutamate desuccinylase
MDRILGKIEGDLPGPLIICVAALHGNEQIGLHAFRNVISAIEHHQIPFRGKMVGITGNAKAIARNVRFIDYDLNRIWKQEYIDKLAYEGYEMLAEDEEMKDIMEVIDRESEGNYTEKILLDLHATSSDLGNFIVVPESESFHPVIKSIHLPVVVELNRYLEGTMIEYYHDKGYLAFVIEGGKIGTEGVYRLHTSGLWEVLDKIGCIHHHDHENEDHYQQQLAEISAHLPKKVKALHRHRLQKGDGFQMLPGFHNFQPIYKGQHLAMDKNGPIFAERDGMIFMPLYQNDGEDGFFIVQDISDHVNAGQSENQSA